MIAGGLAADLRTVFSAFESGALGKRSAMATEREIRLARSLKVLEQIRLVDLARAFRTAANAHFEAMNAARKAQEGTTDGA